MSLQFTVLIHHSIIFLKTFLEQKLCTAGERKS